MTYPETRPMEDIMRFDGRPPARVCSIAVLAAAGLMLAGCSNEPVASPEPAPGSAPAPSSAPTSPSPGTSADADPAALEWTAAVCTALTPLTVRVQMPPAPDLSDAAATQDTFSSYLAMAVADADQAVEGITAAGAPPVEGGDEIAAAVSTQVDELRTELTEAMARVEGADPNNPINLGRVAVGAGADVIGSLGEIVEVATTLSDDPTLGPAFEQSPECAPLRMIGIPA
ncbi:MAG: hypothetical protein L0I24_16295 [Pseudonocardia sp.]|nr:hypothetical protein [Pseudonocardia sp.]